MAYTLLIHVLGEEPILADAERLPEPQDNFVRFANPRKRDGKPVSYIARGATDFFLPWHRISIVEVLRGEEEEVEIVEFFRE
ncbi:MAG: hypothetical protein ACP5SI_02080 [Chloroflexia bacterium]